jgi:beta-phosphoglucomutase
MSGLKALLVDLDGTLVDTAEANFAAYRAALGEYGVNLTREWWDANGFGRNWREFLPALLDGNSNVAPAEVAARKTDLYPNYVAATLVNEPLVRLIRLLKASLRVALVTSASRSAAALLLEVHDLRSLFDEVVTGDDVTVHKPAPLAFTLAAERLGVRPDECMIIEDSEAGIAAAAAFGAPCLVVENFADGQLTDFALAS